jgi:hypothetical protein
MAIISVERLLEFGIFHFFPGFHFARQTPLVTLLPRATNCWSFKHDLPISPLTFSKAPPLNATTKKVMAQPLEITIIITPLPPTK